MEELGSWVIKIAGIIVLGALCDMIMPNGGMKKYVGLLVGLVLVAAVITPIAGFSFKETEYSQNYNNRRQAQELKNRMSEKEQIEVIRIYKRKLSENIKNELGLKNGDAEIDIAIETDKEESFGNIKRITIVFNTYCTLSDDEIYKKISEEYGVARENIRIEKRNGD